MAAVRNRPAKPPSRPSSGASQRPATPSCAAEPTGDAPPADGIVIAADPKRPHCTLVFRHAGVREANPERLNLDRRNLTSCPILHDESRLRLLNLENNAITQISNLHTLTNLIFLDLYNNQIAQIGGLDCLPTLRVLMLGKNRIRRIDNLSTLLKLDVLDLHSNLVEEMSGLDALRDLRVLNLAGNAIQVVDNIARLTSLTELNLRRNRIQVLDGSLLALQALSRVFMSHNNLSSMPSIEILSRLRSLTELSLDGNPVADDSNPFYRQMVLDQFPALRILDGKRIGPDERRMFSTMKLLMSAQRPAQAPAPQVQSGGASNGDQYRQLFLQAAQPPPPSRQAPSIPLAVERGDLIQAVKAAWNQRTHRRPDAVYHEVLAKKTQLSLYGPCLDALITNRCSTVRAIAFHYVDFNECAAYFASVRDAFPALRSLLFHNNDLHTFYQLDTLSVFANLTDIDIAFNPIVEQQPNYRQYLLFRVPTLERTNGNAVAADTRSHALARFEPLKSLWKTESIRRVQGFCPPTMILPAADDEQAHRARTLVDDIVRAVQRPAERSRRRSDTADLVGAVIGRQRAFASMDRQWPGIVTSFVDESVHHPNS